jgi:hypothetical protein
MACIPQRNLCGQPGKADVHKVALLVLLSLALLFQIEECALQLSCPVREGF